MAMCLAVTSGAETWQSGPEWLLKEGQGRNNVRSCWSAPAANAVSAPAAPPEWRCQPRSASQEARSVICSRTCAGVCLAPIPA